MVLCMDNVGQTLVSYLQQSRRILVTPKMDFGSAEIHLIGVNALEQKPPRYCCFGGDPIKEKIIGQLCRFF